MKIVAKTNAFKNARGEYVVVREASDGSARIAGCGYSQSVKHRSVEVAMAKISSDARFNGWSQP